MDLIIDSWEKMRDALPLVGKYRDIPVFAVRPVPATGIRVLQSMQEHRDELCMAMIWTYGGFQWILVRRDEVMAVQPLVAYGTTINGTHYIPGITIAALTVEDVRKRGASNKIHAIKSVREITGVVLIEAKIWVEAHPECYQEQT